MEINNDDLSVILPGRPLMGVSDHLRFNWEAPPRELIVHAPGHQFRLM